VIPFATNMRAAGLMSLTMALFCVSDAILKGLFQRLPIGEVMALRGAAVILVILAVQGARGRLPPVAACLDRTTVVRALVELAVATAFFLALREIPLANATTLIFASPILMTALATVVLGETVGLRRWSAVIVGFLGVLLVTSPGAEGWQPAALWALLAAFLVAIRDLMTRFIPSHVDAGAVALTTAAVVTAGGLTTLPFAWLTPTASELALIGIGALLIATAYATIVMTFRMGEMSFVAPFRYVSIPLAMLVGWLGFGDVPGWNMLAGAAVIVASGLFIFHRERRHAARRAPA
jgi:drug/metabolite transporter (DMT)-like permease